MANKQVDRREAVMAAALDLFDRQSFGGTTMPEIARRAGVAAGTIYVYFPSKEALANAIYQRWKHELARYLFDGHPTGATPRAEFGHYWRRLTDFAMDYPTALSFIETHRHDAYLDPDSLKLTSDIDAQIAAFVRRGQRAKQIRPGKYQALNAMVLGAFLGLVRARASADLPMDRKMFTQFEDAAWALLAAPTQ